MIFNYVRKKTPNVTCIGGPTKHIYQTKQNKQKYTRSSRLYRKTIAQTRTLINSRDSSMPANGQSHAPKSVAQGQASSGLRRSRDIMGNTVAYVELSGM